MTIKLEEFSQQRKKGLIYNEKFDICFQLIDNIRNENKDNIKLTSQLLCLVVELKSLRDDTIFDKNDIELLSSIIKHISK